MTDPKAKRNAEIVRLHVEDRMTLTAIGLRYGITKERVRQIVRRAGVSPSVTSAVLKEKSIPCVEVVCETCGTVVWRKPYRSGGIGKFCSPRCFHASGGRAKWTPEMLLDELRRLACILDRTPGMKDLVAPWPTHMLYYRRFGLLSNACKLAGLTPNARGGAGHGGSPLPDGFREEWAHLALAEEAE